MDVSEQEQVLPRTQEPSSEPLTLTLREGSEPQELRGPTLYFHPQETGRVASTSLGKQQEVGRLAPPRGLHTEAPPGKRGAGPFLPHTREPRSLSCRARSTLTPPRGTGRRVNGTMSAEFTIAVRNPGGSLKSDRTGKRGRPGVWRGWGLSHKMAIHSTVHTSVTRETDSWLPRDRLPPDLGPDWARTQLGLAHETHGHPDRPASDCDCVSAYN